jgi:hypothetical protein
VSNGRGGGGRHGGLAVGVEEPAACTPPSQGGVMDRTVWYPCTEGKSGDRERPPEAKAKVS